MTEYLILASSFNRWAGPNNHLLDVCNYLYNELRIDFRLVTHNVSFHNDFSSWIKFPVLPVLEGSRPDPMTRLVCVPANTRIVKRTIRSLKISKEKIFVNASLDTLFETRFATNARISTGYNVLCNDTKSILFNSLDRLAAITSISRVMAHTKYQKHLYMKTGIEEKRIRIIPHCIDVKRIEMMSRQSNEETKKRPIIFYGGRLNPEKGVKELVSCYEEVCKKLPATLILVGEGPMRDWILQRKGVIERRNKNALIVLFPWQNQAEFLRLMAGASIVSVPSHVESFGMVILEAMSLSKPVLATSFGGPPEIITHGQDGMIVDPFDARKLQESVLELLGDEKKSREMGRNALKTVQSKFEVTKVAPRFLEFMEDG